MSEMQVFYGTYRKSDVKLLEDEDVYDAEERLNIQLVDVDGDLYEYESLEDVDPYGFTLNIKPSDQPRIMCMWYNGGAGTSEVVEEAIRNAGN